MDARALYGAGHPPSPPLHRGGGQRQLGGLLVGLTIASKTASNVGWFIMWVQAIEIFPTALRNTGLTVSAVVATLICMTGPYVVDLGLVEKRLPFLVFTIFGIFGIIFSSFVPESKGLPLAETAQDIVRMAREFKYFTWRTWRRERTVA